MQSTLNINAITRLHTLFLMTQATRAVEVYGLWLAAKGQQFYSDVSLRARA